MNSRKDKKLAQKESPVAEKLKRFGLKNEDTDTQTVDEAISDYSNADKSQLKAGANLGIIDRLRTYGLSKR